MKKLILAAALISSSAYADKFVFQGSDTLKGAMSDAITAATMDDAIQYAGGGSGKGEAAIVAGTQGIAPMSREFKADLRAQLQSQGVTLNEHVLALDGISMYVNGANATHSLDIPTIARIYNCEFTKWEQIPGSAQTGDIKVYRRNDDSGTTDAFKHFTGIKTFGACVVAVNETADITDVTSRDPQAIGYAGLSGKGAKNKDLAIASKPGVAAVLPATATIRNFSYPMARKLFVYEVAGARTPNQEEADLISWITDRDNMDAIMIKNEFITID